MIWEDAQFIAMVVRGPSARCDFPGDPSDEIFEQTESLRWFGERCDRLLHWVTIHVAHIERELRAAIEHLDASLALRTCLGCGDLQPDRAPLADPVPPDRYP